MSTNITEQEAREAAGQIPAWVLLESSKEVREVLMWATRELSRRDAERAERLLPIDEPWLKTRGEVVRDDDDAFGVRICDKANAILQRPTVFTKVLRQKPGTVLNMNIDGCRISVIVETRGELLDWERALKGYAE